METMKAFWRYDWQRNWGRHVALAILALAWPWAMEAAVVGMRDGAAWAVVILPVGMAGFLAGPLLWVSDVIELGRAGSPREPRHFVHTLPVDRGEWAVAKLLGALVYVGLVPALLLVAMVFAAKLTFGTPFGLKIDVFSFLCTSAVGIVWTMLWAALLPHRWVLLGIPVFVLGEGLARGATSLDGLATSVARTLLAHSLDMGLLVLLALLLAAVFVRYHQRRSRGWALLAAFVALGGIDGVRALVWWLIRTRL